MNVMIVDDEPLVLQGMMDGVDWESLRFAKVLTAGSYTEALRVMEKDHVDILLSDIEMPGESGLKLIEYVNAHSANTECIILTCHDDFHYAQSAVRLNCMEYILKPVRYAQLTETLRRAQQKVLARKESEQMKEYGQRYIGAIAEASRGDTVNALDTAVAYISSHLSEELSVRDIASACYISADHLTRLFKKKFGQTVLEYIQEKRMHLAGELLRRKDLTISMVANTVGFSNYSYFTEQFKKTFGMTPREYQKQQKE